MPVVTFRYQKEQGGRGVIARPVADVEFLSRQGEWIECHPLIDSGADVSLVPLSFGKLLGLELAKEKVKEVYGLGRQAVPVIYLPLSIKIGPHELTAEFGWALIEDLPPLLGRKDIFDIFHVSFQQDRSKILFEWQG